MRTRTAALMFLALALGYFAAAIQTSWQQKECPVPTEPEILTFTNNTEYEVFTVSCRRNNRNGIPVAVYDIFYRDGSEIKYKYLGDKVIVKNDCEDGQYNYIQNDTIHIHNYNEIQKR